ncbi:MAG: sugar ABC transporter permease [Anaerolineae bacterium]|nr:sugar ABC transporter permease [Anaerolineae bacterium]MCO5188326.1 sugar ABC transporter permease [Anaerolineae bacterium]MCO5206834.1 sugar ABC transporter permease [Anaerolineae bacterium]
MATTTAQTAAAEQHRASERKRERRETLSGYMFISPWLIGFLIFTLLPLIGSLYLAFTDYNLTSAPEWVGLQNFETMFFNDPRYWKAVRATFYYVFAAIPARLTFALAVAMILDNHRRGIGFYRAAYYAPSIIGGSVAVALMWRRIFASDGVFNGFLNILGVPASQAWIGLPSSAIWTLILLAVWQFGSPMLIFLAGLRQIPESLYESAEIDGATPWRKFFHITIPLLSSVIFFNLIMQLISGFLVFTQALVITNGGPLDSTLFYALYLYQRAFVNFQMGYGTAMAWVLLVIIAIFTAIAFKTSSAWVFYEDEG